MDKKTPPPLTYISLFSSSGVGCFAFKQNGFQCIATNELIERRLNIQKINEKCLYSSGYISGDITLNEIKSKIFKELDFWKKHHNIKSLDVLIATPPCQGMSVANHKKHPNEIKRNSLVLESIYMVSEIKPKIFLFENVPSFLKTACVDDNQVLSIGDAIDKHLSEDYLIKGEILNFKNYGSNSSRKRTLVIGVLKKYLNEFTPEDLFPSFRQEKNLKDVIGHLPSLSKIGEFSKNDFLHSFRKYDPQMRSWIEDIKEGQSAFDNTDLKKRPHKLVGDRVIPNKNKNGDKYKRQFWDKVAPCVHTRNDQLASQNTIHPNDDRVFSIRELMLMMSVPESFRWFQEDLNAVNLLSEEEKAKILKRHEINIRQSLGEAVPTGVFDSIAKNVKKNLGKKSLTISEIYSLIRLKKLDEHSNLMDFLKSNKFELSLKTITTIAEYANSAREKNSAYYTDKMLVHNIYSILPEFKNKDKLRILEPSVGIGSFIPSLIKKYKDYKEIEIDCIDLSKESLELLRFILDLNDIGENVKINYVESDFLQFKIMKKYDLVVGNPPFGKIESKNLLSNNDFINLESNNISSYFIEKCLKYADRVVMIMPKNVLNAPEFNLTRDYINRFCINTIIDFGEFGFRGVLIETVCLSIDTKSTKNKTQVKSLPLDISKIQNQSYITSKSYPYWLIYRNDYFDNFVSNLHLDVFTVFRDRQITKTNTVSSIGNGNIRVLKSRNITDDGKIVDINNYDTYIEKTKLNQFSISKFIDKENIYLTPNMTYKTRLIKKPKNTIANGSLALLIPKFKKILTKDDLLFFSSKEYREYMQIARNHQTRTLNVDSNSVFFYGIKKN